MRELADGHDEYRDDEFTFLILFERIRHKEA